LPISIADFGAVELDGETCFWKIDYYDQEMAGGSEDPDDPEKTTRVLTIMRAPTSTDFTHREELAMATQLPSYQAFTVIKREGQDDFLRWPRLSEQIFRVDKWSLCRVRLPSGGAAA
jgi:Protein of unknown function (DUF3768)